MERVTRSSALTELPARPDVEGDPGFFGPGDKTTGTPASVPGYEWFNMVQEELCNVVTQLGGTPLSGDAYDQVANAILVAISQAVPDSIDWGDVLNKPSTFPPSGHSHSISQVTNLQDILDRIVPVGSVISFAGTTPPSGWALCYGQELSRTDFADLFAAISTGHGAGNGSTTFNLPDHRGRVSAGKDNMGGASADRLTGQSGGVNGDVLGAVGGAERHTLTESELPSNMDMTAAHGDSGTGSYLRTSGLDNFGNTTISIELGNNTPHNNVQPTIVLNKIIKLYKGI